MNLADETLFLEELRKRGLTRLLPAGIVSRTTGKEVPGSTRRGTEPTITRDQDRGSAAALPGEAGRADTTTEAGTTVVDGHCRALANARS
jgi:hypothetical protein